MAKVNPQDPAYKGDGQTVVLPKGTYFLAGCKLTRGESSQKKTPYVDVTMVVYGGDHHGDKTRIRYYLSEKSLFRIANLADACGYQDEFDTDVDAELGEAVLGRVFRAQVKVETPKAGEQWPEKNDVGFVNRLTEPEEAQIDSIVEKLGDPLAPKDGDESDDPTGGGEDSGLSDDDDSIPF